MNIQDNGLMQDGMTLNCSIRMDRTHEQVNAWDRLQSFMTQAQVNTKFPFGKFGFLSNYMSSPFSLDPDATSLENATKGLVIKSVEVVWNPRENKTIIINIGIVFGGTI